ncbi:hypothetical protein CQY20_30595 [Mycolicibacterium agri]|uniref:Membrane protein n=1 Tax=Mycolicibacterium agri TaxID=36811 RepID=A0A2A7MPH0_MYCAG|nr:hypothetical protein [Mycolicibacterium agri]PEG33469.1 hypothetical protein CQY20_30595 [Mycolicibacterium agri]GFG49215.1 membrane protein [Mycolicibacterium agri]
MDTLTLRWPCWPTPRAFTRNPLVRTVDRVEAVVVLMAVAVALMAIPVVAAIGTAVHDARSHVYAEQAQTRRQVDATVTGVPPTEDELVSVAVGDHPMPRRTVMVAAQWVVDGKEHHGLASAVPTVKPGDRVSVWVDKEGHRVSEPAPVSRAGMDATLAALGIWSSVAAAAAAVAALTRAALNRFRAAEWQRDIDNLLCPRG